MIQKCCPKNINSMRNGKGQFIKGNVPWIKDKYHSKEAKIKMGEAQKGKKPSEEHKRKIKENNVRYWLGKYRSEETKKKIRETKKGKPSPKKGKYGLWKHSEETIKKMKATWNTPEKKEYARLRRLKQKIPVIDTSIERKTKEWLDSKKINYIHPFNLGDRFQCDFYIPALNLIVECDGTYWHSLPKRIKNDKAKDIYAKQNGFNIIRLTEEQINQGRFF